MMMSAHRTQSVITRDGGVARLIGEAVRSGHDGELRLRRDQAICRIFVVAGRIAWAHTDGRHGTLVERLLEERPGFSRARLAELVRDCQTEQTNLGERLVALELLEPATLRRVLLAHIRAQVDPVRNAQGPLTGIFVPRRRAYSGRFTFTLDDVVRGEVHADAKTQQALGWVHAAWERAAGSIQLAAVGVRDPGRVPYIARLGEQLSEAARSGVERLIERRALGTLLVEHHLCWGDDGLVFYECAIPGAPRRALLAAQGVLPGLLVAHADRLVRETPWPA